MTLRLKKMDSVNKRKWTLSASLDSLKVTLSYSEQYLSCGGSGKRLLDDDFSITGLRPSATPTRIL